MKQAKVLTDKELKKVIEYIDAFDRHAERNKAIVLLTHYLGLRISECGSLLVENVINDKGEVNDVIQDPIWAYSVGTNGAYEYNSGASIDFQIHESDETDLVIKILAYTGIIIKDPTVIQVAAQKEVNDFNQDNV